MSEYAEGAETFAAPVRSGVSNTSLILVLFILFVIILSVFFTY
jgi:hypothetical protein